MRSIWIFTFALTVLGALFTATGSTLALDDSFFRIVTGGALVLLIPGFVCSEIFRIRERSFLSRISISAFFSLCILTFVALLSFALHLTIGTVAVIFLGSNLAASIYLYFTRKRPTMPTSPLDRVDYASVITILIFALILYFMADSIKQVDWEVGLHFNYIRHYASELPLSFADSVLRPGELVPGNHFFLWEFAVATISKVSGVDVLIAGLRSRWLIPVIGFSGLFFMTESMTSSRRTAQIVTAIGLVMTALQFQFAEPFRWMNAVITGNYRGIMMFLGSVHHSDVAMEILMPLALALLFRFFWRRSLVNGFFFVMSQILMFFWHPREFFQVAWIAFIAVFAHILTSKRGTLVRNIRSQYLPIVASFVVSTILLFGLNFIIGGVPQEQSEALSSKHEIAVKIFEMAKTFSFWTDVQPLFHYVEQKIPELKIDLTPGTFSWLVLAAAMLIPCLFSNRRRVRWAGVFFFSLWFLTLCYVPSQWLLTLGTYGEILMSKSRFMFPFFIILIALGWTEISRRFTKQKLIIVAVATGIGYWIVWRRFPTEPNWMTWTTMVLLFGATIWTVLRTRKAPRRWPEEFAHLPRTSLIVLSFAILIVPVSITQAARFWKDEVFHKVNPLELFSAGNIVGISPELISFLRTSVPARSRVQVEPAKARMIGVFAPLYVRPLSGFVIKDLPEHEEARQDRHPLFNSKVLNGSYDFSQMTNALKERRTDFILAEGEYVPAYRNVVKDHGQELQIAFESPPENGVVNEMIVKVIH